MKCLCSWKWLWCSVNCVDIGGDGSGLFGDDGNAGGDGVLRNGGDLDGDDGDYFNPSSGLLLSSSL